MDGVTGSSLDTQPICHHEVAVGASEVVARGGVATARRIGAAGYLLKTEPADAIIAAIRAVAAGGTAFGSLEANRYEEFELSERERDVVASIVSGLTNSEIAGRLGISTKGVEAHLSRLYERANVASRTELAIRAERERWLGDV